MIVIFDLGQVRHKPLDFFLRNLFDFENIIELFSNYVHSYRNPQRISYPQYFLDPRPIVLLSLRSIGFCDRRRDEEEGQGLTF